MLDRLQLLYSYTGIMHVRNSIYIVLIKVCWNSCNCFLSLVDSTFATPQHVILEAIMCWGVHVGQVH